MAGYIKLHRQTLENPIVTKDADHLAVWVYLLLNATHKETDCLFRGNRITLQPGQLLTGRVSIAKKLNISESKVKRVLTSFEIDQQIDRQRGNKNSLITVKNWSKYQSCDQQNDQQVTSNRPASDQQVTTNKNVKNIKNVKNERKDIYSVNPALNKAIIEMIENRKRLKKPMTQRAIELMIDRLDKMATNDTDKIAIINQSIERGWSGVFEIEQDGRTPTTRYKGVTEEI